MISFSLLFVSFFVCVVVGAGTSDRAALSYVNLDPSTLYEPTASSGTTLWDFINSRDDLSMLADAVQIPAGFEAAFKTSATWSFTFFAPNNDAFNQTGQYYDTFKATPKGKFWLGNLLLHHYVPNTKLASSVFTTTKQRFLTGTYLYVSAQKESDVVLNDVANIVESDISVANGTVHIIDHLLDPSAQIFEADLSKISQSFIAGGCTNTAYSYC